MIFSNPSGNGTTNTEMRNERNHSQISGAESSGANIQPLSTLKVNNQKIERVLLTNDDGYNAKGMQVLIKIASEIAHEVWVVAPKSDQSGQSQSITLHQPLHCEKHKEKHFLLDGTPSDCVIFALKHLMRECPPQLILSGVNRGANIADSVAFSGTIGATLTAASLGIPAIALSQLFRNKDSIHWSLTEELAGSVIHHLIESAFSNDIFNHKNLSIEYCYNINFPDHPIDEISGFSYAQQGRGSIADIKIDTHITPRGKECHWYEFKHDYSAVRDSVTEISVLRKKAIAISRVNVVRNTL